MKTLQGILFVIDDDRKSRMAVAALALSLKIKCETFVSAEAFLGRYTPSLTGWRGRFSLGRHGRPRDARPPARPGQRPGRGAGQRLRRCASGRSGMAGGAVAFIEKPYRNDDLTDAVARRSAAAARRGSRTRPGPATTPPRPNLQELASFLELRREARTRRGTDPARRSTEMISLRGKLLTAAPTQLDPTFQGGCPGGRAQRPRGLRPDPELSHQPARPPGMARFTGAMLPAGQALLGGPVTGPLMAVHTNGALGRTGNLARHLLFGKTEEGGQTPVRPDPAVQVLRRLCRLGPAATGLRSGAGHLARSFRLRPSKFSRTAAVSGSGFPARPPGCDYSSFSTSSTSLRVRC